jgi:glyoxylase-like metal-dependent hydrolase (beta-lactamase superfamily II)
MAKYPSWLQHIELPMPATLGSVNVYLIRGPSGAALIDTGFNDSTSRKELEDQLRARDMVLSDIDTLVCTHHHQDHTGLGQVFSDAGVTTVMSSTDAKSLAIYLADEESDESKASFGACHEMPTRFIERVAGLFPFFRTLAGDFVPDVTLEEGDEITLGGIPFQVMITPGHTPGHICLVRDEFVLTGDCVIRNDLTHVSMRSEVIGTDPFGQFLQSFKRIGELEGKIGLPGHGPVIENLAVRAKGIIVRHNERLDQVRAALGDKPRPAFELSRDALGSRSQSFAVWLIMSQTLAYLEHLVHLQEAEEIVDNGMKRYKSKSV